MRDYKALFTIWDTTGKISYHSTKYLGWKFTTMDEYYGALGQYYNKETWEELRQFMIDFCNQELQKLKVCDNEIRITAITPSFNTSSPADMAIIYEGMSGNHKTEVNYTKDPNFECPVEDEYGDCFEYECVSSVVINMSVEFRKKFGIRMGSFESSEVESFD